MKKFHVKKPDIKGAFHKLKNIKREDVKVYWEAKRERRSRILEERRNSAFARKMPDIADISCASGMYDQFCDRGGFQTLGSRSMELYDRDTGGVPV